MEEAKLRSFPLLRDCPSSTLWCSRNVLEVSLCKENLMALYRGANTCYMTEHASGLKNRCAWRAVEAEQSVEHNEMSEKGGCMQARMYSAQCEVVNESSMYQFSVEEPDYKLMEQRISFLGCSIECLRTSLGKWASRNMQHDETA